MIKVFILIIVILLQPVSALGKYEIKYTSNHDIEMYNKSDKNPSNKFRGSIDDNGHVRMKNQNGEIIRGNLDSAGYGKLRDPDGNTYRVKPYWNLTSH